jgi:RHS repeat-associated protein
VLSLVLDRGHFSGYRSGVHFGQAWASTLDQRLVVGTDRVDVALDDGTLLVFPVPGTEGVPPVDGPLWTLSRVDEGAFLLAQPELRRTLHFGPVEGQVRWLTAISDGDGNRVTFERDADGVPVEIRHSAGHRIAVTTSGRLISELASVGDAGDRTVVARFGYDDHSRLVEVVNSSGRPYRFSYDDAGRIVAWQDRNGWGYEFAYDERHRCVRGTGSQGVLDYTFRYDPENRTNYATNSLGHTTTYELNEEFQLVRETDPLGGVITYEWDRHDRLLTFTDQLGHVTRYAYDRFALVTSQTLPDGTVRTVRNNAQGRPTAQVEPDGAVTAHEYDEGGRLRTTTDAMGGVRHFDYDSQGSLTTFVDEEGRRTRLICDGLGKPLQVLDPAGGDTRYDYDRLGRVVSVTDPLGNVTGYAWTVEGELWKRTSPDGSSVRFTYDGEINVCEEIDASGAVTRIDFGPFDLPVCEIAPDGSRTRFAYDTELQLVSVVNGAGAEWRIEYDAAGRVTRETDFDGRVATYTRDAAGQLIESRVGDEVIRYRLDALGRVTEKRAGDLVTRLTYDAAGRLLRAVNPDTDLELAYDRLGRVITETCDGREVRSSYDRTGHRVGRFTASGTETTWAYEPGGMPVEVRTAGRAIRFAHDLAGREIGRALGAAQLTQTWDVNNRLIEQVVTGANPAAVLQRRVFTHRQDDVLAGVDDLLSGQVNYDLDRLGRVTAVRGAGREEQYSYDRADNVRQATWAAAGTHPAEGVRSFVGNRISRAGDVGYEHDERGRLVGRGGAQFGWNAEDQLADVQTQNGERWHYTYDALGRRRAKQLLGTQGEVVHETLFVWDGLMLAEEIVLDSGAPAHTTTWEWQPGEPSPVSRLQRRWTPEGEVVDEQFHAVVTDLVGSPAELVDEMGRISWHADWSLWGAGQSDGAAMPLRFPGQYFDAETGLHYNMHRYYEPETGRYLSPDPIGLRGGLNPHAYVPNPTIGLDPLGLKGKCKGGKSNNPVLSNNRTNGNGRGQPVFHGNARVPVTEISDKKFVDVLENLSKGRGEGARRATELLKQMREGNGWQQTAGIHQGGLGGAAGGADPRPHITVSVGNSTYHVHVGESNGKLYGQDITPTPIRRIPVP